MATKRARQAEDEKRRKTTRARFRNLIRSVIFNRVWLSDTSDQKLTLNVKKNILLLVRQQRKIGMLTLAEKTLIRTNHFMRTTEDRKKLVTLLAGLTCFAKIPPKVRARLAPIIKFMYLGQGRQIIKEGDPPNTIYFVLTGEVEITKTVFDHLTNSYIERIEFISGSGDCLGDVELIEEIPRVSTCVATTDVELLVLYRPDFDRILRPIMGKQWMDKKKAVLGLGYFNFLPEEQIVGTCKLGILRQFEPLETIYYEDKGHVSYVHFVISGECMILQCLRMKVTQKKGYKTFELVDISKDGGDTMFQDLTNKELIKKMKEEESETKNYYDIESVIASNEDVHDGSKQKNLVRKMDIKSIEIACGLVPESTIELVSQKSSHSEHLGNDKPENNGEENGANEHIDLEEMDKPKEILEDQDQLENNTTTKRRKSSTSSRRATEENINKESESKEREKEKERASILNESKMEKNGNIEAHQNETIKNIDNELDPENKHSDTTQKLENEEPSLKRPSDPNETTANQGAQPKKSSMRPKSNTNIENHFIDVGSMTFGGIFGLGEKLEHRVIMARTTVQCLMLPRFYLFGKERNPGNIWQRRRFYLDTTIPSRQTLFEDFLTTRKWQKFKNDLIESSLDPNTNANPTKVQDIPIICRIVEASDE